VKPALADITARARGLGSHLLCPAAIRQLAACRTLGVLAAELARVGYPVEPVAPLTAADLDRVVAAVAGSRLNLLARWLGPRLSAVRSLFEGREVAALRAVVRGIAAGAAPATRVRGIIPTPLLPGPVLARIAGAESMPALRRLLVQADHPAAEVLARAPGAANHADLLRTELALRRWWAARVIAGARRAGNDARRLTEATLDRENLIALLEAGAWGVELSAQDVFLPGGRRLPLAAFQAAASEPDTENRRTGLARTFHGTPAGRILADPGVALEAIPRRLLGATIAEARRESGLRPMSLAPLVEVVLRIEAEARDLRQVVHGMALEAPAARAIAGLVAAA
jgi:vacuolar-type H+-ATPase subunit C/Vma6